MFSWNHFLEKLKTNLNWFLAKIEVKNRIVLIELFLVQTYRSKLHIWCKFGKIRFGGLDSRARNQLSLVFYVVFFM